MRTTVEENVRQGRWIAERLNQCEGEVRFLLPMGGVSALDAPGTAFLGSGRGCSSVRYADAPNCGRLAAENCGRFRTTSTIRSLRRRRSKNSWRLRPDERRN